MKQEQRQSQAAVMPVMSYEGLDFPMSAGKNKHIRFQSVSSHEQNHGRIEDRYYAVSDCGDCLIERHPAWKSICSIGMVESGMKGDITVERRYSVSSEETGADAYHVRHGNEKQRHREEKTDSEVK